MTRQQQEWGSRLGVILAVAGSAVGLGNFLRFPGQAAANGGGAFMIPYFCALLFLGIPIGWAEWTMGRYGGRKGFHSAPSIMGVFGRGALFRYLTGGIGIAPGAPIPEQTAAASSFYDDFTGRTENGVLAGGSYKTFLFWMATFAVNIWLVFRGISRGIEKFVSWAMPIMAVL